MLHDARQNLWGWHDMTSSRAVEEVACLEEDGAVLHDARQKLVDVLLKAAWKKVSINEWG